MDLLQNLLFSFLGRLFEAIDIVTKQSSINTCLQCKLPHIDFRMGQEKALHFRGFSLVVSETLKTDIHVQFPPMDADGADFILLSLRIRSFQQIFVPKQRLTIGFPVVAKAIEPLPVKPYFIDFHHLPS